MKLEEIIEAPIYYSLRIKIFDDENDSKKDLPENDETIRSIFVQKTVDIYCVDCKKQRIFNVQRSYFAINDGVRENERNYLNAPNYHRNFDFIDSRLPQYVESIDGYFYYHLNCASNRQHTYLLILKAKNISKTEVEFIKVGQYPIFKALNDSKEKVFKKELKTIDATEDYGNYITSVQSNLLAGACTYLRRVLEKMVLYYIQDSQRDSSKCNHFDQKIELVVDRFDEAIRDALKTVYGLLSKGIHELNNDEIEEFYCCMSFIIDMQLSYEKEKREREERITSMKKRINISAQKYR